MLAVTAFGLLAQALFTASPVQPLAGGAELVRTIAAPDPVPFQPLGGAPSLRRSALGKPTQPIS
ncbi:MAG: hypothetical protein ABIO80_10225 [Sphingomicrobium sp.]